MTVLIANCDTLRSVRLQLRFDHEERRSDTTTYAAGERRGAHQFNERGFTILILKPPVILKRGERSKTEAIHNKLIP